MEREIANVAAASGMRGFRYMAFPPIVFEAPLVLEAPVWEPPVVQVTEPPMPAPIVMPAEAPARPRPAWVAQPAPPPPPLPPADRRFALLAEVSAEIRRHAP